MAKKGHIPWNKGKTNIYSKEVREKISNSLRGKKQSFETISKRIKKLKGKKHSETTKLKMSLASKGKPKSLSHRKKLSDVSKGKRYSLGYKHTIQSRKKMSLARKGKPAPWKSGDKCFFWKGGVTPINAKIRSSLEYKLWRIAVFERDGYKCIFGGIEHGSKIEADHIKSFAYYPELRFAIDNGRTLCHECHKLTDNYAFKAKKIKN